MTLSIAFVVTFKTLKTGKKNPGTPEEQIPQALTGMWWPWIALDLKLNFLDFLSGR